MKILILFNLFLCFSISGQINHIDYKIDSDSSYRFALDDFDYSKSIRHLSKVNKKYGKLYCEEYILMAHCFKQLGRNTKSAKCLKKAWSTYAFDLECLGQIPQIDLVQINNGFSKNQQKIVQRGYNNFAKLKRSNTDSLKLIFEVMLEKDQRPRLKLYSDSIIDTAAIYNEMKIVDSLNLIEFRNIILKFGYPGEWILPGIVSNTFVLLVHSSYNQVFFDEMKPVFLKEVIDGHMPPSYYALWLDRHEVKEGGAQTFGMLNIPNSVNLSEKERQQIILNRLQIGLIKNCQIPTKMLLFN